MKAADKITKARTGLILDMPFFGSLALRLVVVENDGQPTMQTDGKRLKYNSAFVDKLSLSETKGVLAHEVMHCANQHHLRIGNRNLEKWNRACDYAINDVLIKSGVQLPKGALNDPQYAGMSAEAIYTRLPDQPDGDGQGEDPGGCGGVMPATGDDSKPADEAEISKQAADWKVAVAQAATQARSMGNMPAELDRLVKELVAAKVDWRETLRRFIQQVAKNDYRWSPPNRRHVHAGLYLPSMRSEEIGDIVVAVDTSGSIGQEELKQFASEINSILEEYDTTCRVIYCDAAVQSIEVFRRDDLPLVLHVKGGGGTDFRPAFQSTVTGELDHGAPACFIYLTDMAGTFPDTEPGYPVLWVSTSSIDQAPFGEVVKMN